MDFWPGSAKQQFFACYSQSFFQDYFGDLFTELCFLQLLCDYSIRERRQLLGRLKQCDQ